MRINTEIGELQAFLAVAQKSSFRAASESLFISQPALSRRIDKLEKDLKCQLLERTTRRVSLTDAGRQFLSHAQAVIDELERAYQGLEARAVARTGKVTIACVPSVANHLLPSVLKDFARTYPSVRVKVIDESAQTVLDSVREGLADFGLSFLGSQEAELDFTAIRAERYVVVVPKEHALARRKTVAWRQLEKEPLVSVSSTSGNRLLIDSAFAKTSKRPTIQYEINHVTGAINLVAAGLGIAIIPGLALDAQLHPGLMGVPLVDPAITRTLGLIVRKGDKIHDMARVLADTLSAAIRDS
ncbi:LysR family transcriptional regulator [Rhodoferax sp. GW822-FHT02A01]|uniref:LysR family transcriptional regulator n=1 Tax=Rhodoferax sp. GW822-FHT02A01 TaxID=3141537 RepID=UPI00315CC5D8